MGMMAPSVAGSGQANGSQQLEPLRPNTRQRMQKLPAQTAAFSTSQTFTLPQVGLLARLFLYANLTISDAAGSPSVTVVAQGPYSILKRITGSTNLGTATVFDISGYGCYQLNKITDTDIETKSVNATVTTDTFYSYPTTYVQTTTKPIQFVLLIPISANDGPQFDVGLINLQASEIRFSIQLTFGATADLYTTSDTLTLAGSVSPYYEYYEVPNPQLVELPARIMHRLVEERITYAAAGDVTYTVPRQGILLQLIQTFWVPSGSVGIVDALTTNVSGRRLVFNKTDTPYNLDYIVDRILNRFRYGHLELPAGTYVWDFFCSDQQPSRGDLRDAIDTESLSTLEAIITTATGVTITAGANFVDNLRRITQQY
jgi:hypothetical protein